MEISKTVNSHFREFLFDWQSKIYFLVGGYGSSKSYHVALKLIIKLLQERRTCLVVREVYDTIRDSCYSLFAEIVESMQLSAVIKFTRSPMQMLFSNGSKVLFRGLDKVEKLKSINDISIIWIEEASEIKYSGFKELLGRLRHPHLKLHMILSLNPVAKNNWCYKHFFVSRGLDDSELYKERILQFGDTYYHHSRACDNKFLPEEYLKELQEMENYDVDLYRTAWLGEFGFNGVKVLPQFEVMNHAAVMDAVEKISARHKYVGVDFGFVESYNAVVRMAVDDANKWLYLYWEFYERGITDDEFADKLEEFIRTREVLHCDSAEAKTIRYLQKRGLNAIAAKKWCNGTRHARLDNTRKMRRFKKIICSDRLKNTINELSDLTYKTDRDGNVIEDEFNIDSHCLSCMWYGLDSYDLASVKTRLSKSDLGL